ncbi:hypothetical protein [Providencia rettgeri]
MNKLPKPEFRDIKELKLIIYNTKLKDHSILNSSLCEIVDSYKSYIRSKGALIRINRPELPSNVGEALKKLYSSPPISHKIIDKMRKDTRVSLCPMCGSLHSGQLDHILPKTTWPEFSILTKNLVPACQCNREKGTITSQNPNIRILHPYYDDILSDRLISINIENLGQVPDISVKIVKKNTHPLYQSIHYHIKNVVLKNGMLDYQKRRWETFYLNPRSIVRGITPKLRKKNEIVNVLIEELKLVDKTHGGKNNWNSIFVSGLINSNVIKWLLVELHSTNRNKDGELNI